MENEKPKILMITSADPTVGPGVVALNFYNAFKNYKFDVDMITKFPVNGYPEFIPVLEKDMKNAPYLERKIKGLVKRLQNGRIRKLKQKDGFYFFYEKETVPPVPVKKITDKITKQYDIVFIVFWQGLLSFMTVDAIYKKLHCQIHFRCVDYSPMAGGCHFTGDCERYKIGCGCCPAIYSKDKNDFTDFNVKYRKNIYNKVKPIVYGNSYMQCFYNESFLLKDYDRKIQVYPLMNNDIFKPLDRQIIRKKYKIPAKKTFIVFFGCQSLSEERKGISYLLKSLEIFYNRLNLEERDAILLLTAGKNIDVIKDRLYFDYKYLGFVNPKDLPDVYNLANVFLSPSVNDAGPSMVNQSLSCGIPVVSFEMGTALDMVMGKGTGYCAKLCDSYDFAHGIESIFRLSTKDYVKMQQECRNVALNFTSEKSFIDKIMKVYEKYKI